MLAQVWLRAVIFADIEPMFALRVVICEVMYDTCPFKAWLSAITICIMFRRAARSVATVLNSKSVLGGGS